MKKTDLLDVTQLEALCRLYGEGRLSRLEEAELEYVLLHSDARSPLIDETREELTLVSLLASAPRRDRRAAKRRRPLMLWLDIAVAACAVIALALTIVSHPAPRADGVTVYMCRDGRVLPADEARREASAIESDMMASFEATLADARSDLDNARELVNQSEKLTQDAIIQ